MASLRDIRKRIRSVQNSQKTTKAMKLVAASKLRRAQGAIVAARPYAQQLESLLARVAARALADRASAPEDAAHPLMQPRSGGRVMLVVITSDRGSCGAFNSNILRRAERFLSENKERFEHIEVATIGRKGRDYFKKTKHSTCDYSEHVATLNYNNVFALTQMWSQAFVDKQIDSVFLLYNEFKSVLNQNVTVRDILPVSPNKALHPQTGRVQSADAVEANTGVDYLYEPSRATVLAQLLPQFVGVQLWRALLESAAAEQGARMTAMDAASKNAQELADGLTLQYNRARQAAITRDLMDIVGGAEALAGQ